MTIAENFFRQPSGGPPRGAIRPTTTRPTTMAPTTTQTTDQRQEQAGAVVPRQQRRVGRVAAPPPHERPCDQGEDAADQEPAPHRRPRSARCEPASDRADQERGGHDDQVVDQRRADEPSGHARPDACRRRRRTRPARRRRSAAGRAPARPAARVATSSRLTSSRRSPHHQPGHPLGLQHPGSVGTDQPDGVPVVERRAARRRGRAPAACRGRAAGHRRARSSGSGRPPAATRRSPWRRRGSAPACSTRSRTGTPRQVADALQPSTHAMGRVGGPRRQPPQVGEGECQRPVDRAVDGQAVARVARRVLDPGADAADLLTGRPCGPSPGRRCARNETGDSGATVPPAVPIARAAAAGGRPRHRGRRAGRPVRGRSGERPPPPGAAALTTARVVARLGADVDDQAPDRDPRRPEVGPGEEERPGVPAGDVGHAGHEQEHGAADEGEERQALDRVQHRPDRRPLDQARVDHPQLGQQQRDRREPRDDVEALRHPVQPGRSRRGVEPRAAGPAGGGTTRRWRSTPRTPPRAPARARRRCARRGGGSGTGGRGARRRRSPHRLREPAVPVRRHPDQLEVGGRPPAHRWCRLPPGPRGTTPRCRRRRPAAPSGARTAPRAARPRPATRPRGRTSVAQRRSSARGLPPMPTLPSSSTHGAPPALAGQRRRTPSGAARAPRGVRPRRARPGWGRRRASPVRSRRARRRCGPGRSRRRGRDRAAAASSARSTASAGRHHRSAGEVHDGARRGHQDRRPGCAGAARRHRSRGPPGQRRHGAGEPGRRVRGRHGPASAQVSTSRHVREPADPQAEGPQPRRPAACPCRGGWWGCR